MALGGPTGPKGSRCFDPHKLYNGEYEVRKGKLQDGFYRKGSHLSYTCDDEFVRQDKPKEKTGSFKCVNKNGAIQWNRPMPFCQCRYFDIRAKNVMTNKFRILEAY